MEFVFGIHNGVEMLLKILDFFHDSSDFLFVLSDLNNDLWVIIFQEIRLGILFKSVKLELIQLSLIIFLLIKLKDKSVNDFSYLLFIFVFFQVYSMLSFISLEFRLDFDEKIMKGS